MTQEQKEKKRPEGMGQRGKEELVLKRERGTRQGERKPLEMTHYRMGHRASRNSRGLGDDSSLGKNRLMSGLQSGRVCLIWKLVGNSVSPTRRPAASEPVLTSPPGGLETQHSLRASAAQE